MVRQEGLTYYVPFLYTRNQRVTPINARILQSSCILVCIITLPSRMLVIYDYSQKQLLFKGEDLVVHRHSIISAGTVIELGVLASY